MTAAPITPQLAAQYLPTPGELDHKYSRGVVQLITGSEQYPGAGVLSVGGASYAGAGMIRFGGSDRSATLVLQSFPEVVLPGFGADALVIGSGWGEDLLKNAERAAEKHHGPLVIDAGALVVPKIRSNPTSAVRVLTPHPGEARRLWEQLNLPGEYPDSQVAATAKLASAAGAIVVLKAATTAVSDGKRTFLYRARTAWPGVAGAGDVLAGVLGSVLARQWKLGATSWLETVAAGVWLHGEAGALAAGVGRGTTRPVRASDIIEGLPAAWVTIPR